MSSQPVTTTHNATMAQNRGLRRRRVGWSAGVSIARASYRWGRVRSSAAAVAALCLVVAILGPSPSASADYPERFKLSAHRGPVLSTARVIGLGGAYTAVGEGIQGYYRTPASLANRSLHQPDFFEYEILFDWMITPGGSVDYDNDQVVGAAGSRLVVLNVGLNFQIGPLALGTFATPTVYTIKLAGPGKGNELEVTQLVWQALGVAYSFRGGEHIIGAALNLYGLSMVQRGNEKGTISAGGIGGDFGYIWRPPELPMRLGTSLRFASKIKAFDEGEAFAGRPLPSSFEIPWELALGVAAYIGPSWKVWNRRLGDDLEHGDDWGVDVLKTMEDRRRVLISMDLVLLGPEPQNTYNLEGWVAGDPRRLAGGVSASFHLGAEAEVFHDRLLVRAGVYTEPDRVNDDLIGRIHTTGSAELRIYDLDIFGLFTWRIKLGATIDWAPRYFNLLVGIGNWH